MYMDLRDYIKKTPIKVIFSVLISFLALYFIWLFPLEHALNKYFSNSHIENIIKNNTSIDTKIKSISYKTNTDFSISIKTPEIKITEGQNEILNIKEFSTRINFLPVFFNRIYIQNLTAQTIKTKIIKNKNGEDAALTASPPLLVKHCPDQLIGLVLGRP